MLRIPTHRPPTPPGEMLREEFLVPLGLNVAEVADRLRVPAAVIEALLAERTELTPDLALRLSRLFGTSAEFWLNGQLAWQLYHAIHAPEAADIEEIRPLPTPA